MTEFNPTLGPIVIDWIEEFLVHGPGDIQGQPIVIDDEFRAFIYRAYELFPRGHEQAGRRIYRRAFLSRQKGRAKSELAGELCCVELLGPVRFDGWDASGDPVGVDGLWLPIGAPVTAPEILCVATEEGQAGNTYDNVKFMLENGACYDEYEDIDTGLKTCTGNGGSVEAITAAAKSKDGGKSTFIVADETHLWTSPRLHDLHSTLTRNITKRYAGNGWMLETSTMYAPGEDSVAEMTHATEAGNPSVLFDHKQIPMTVDIKDTDALRAALIELAGPAAAWTNIEGIIADEFHNPQKKESDNRRYWGNQPVITEERFIEPAVWDALADPEHVIPDRAQVVLGFDGSLNNDSTGVVVVELGATPYVDVIDCWERPEGKAGLTWRVDRSLVVEAIKQAAAKYDVVDVAADPSWWKQTLEELDEEGIPIFEYPQSSSIMTPATKRLYDLITSGGLSHSGDERLRRHMLNAVTKNDARGFRLVKESKKSMRKIDLAVCTVMAVDRAADAGDGVVVAGFQAWRQGITPERLEEMRRARQERVNAAMEARRK
jgi:phage terminase large subunit-like protein